MTAAEILKNARERIAVRANWTRGAYARDVHETPVGPTAPMACQWCALGAMYAISQKDRRIEWMKAHGILHAASSTYFQRSPESVNDGLGHIETLRMYDIAIEMAEGAA